VEILINPQDYTQDIKNIILEIKSRMKNTLVDFDEQDIKVFEHKDEIYILANPVLGEEPIYSELGNISEMTPMRNLTIIYDRDWLALNNTDMKLTVSIKNPRLRILRPDLCVKIAKGSKQDEQTT
jgi:hypothetical protein